ncbi:MAG: FAD-binding protein [Smithellaceae bacterium]|jgi:FAD/FMN-containing dehydrogenase/NAD-dependent dihydropyrimidine dehydrogenase PreA subunit
MKLVEEFKKNAGDIKIIDKDEEREMYSHDIGDVPAIMTKTFFEIQPDFVVQPKSAEEIKKVLAFANDKKIPVIPRGAASWGFGGVIPTNAGIVIDLSPFRRILDINKPQKTVIVEAGARWSDIDIMAKKEGLCLMTYPSSKFSTVAGWIATGGYGINSFRYGHLSNQIISMTVITPSGESKKITPTDPDFAYFVSTEGVFGIIVEVTLKLRDVPQASYAHLFYFENDKSAFAFIEKFIKTKAAAQFNPDVIRFLDENHLNDINEIMHSSVFKKKAGVLVELSNSEDDKKFSEFMVQAGDIEEAPRYVASYLWNERLFGMKTKRLGPTILASETIIPIASAAAFIEKAKRLGVHFGVEIFIDSYIIDEKMSLIMTNFLCDSRKLKYYINLPLTMILTQTSVSMGAEPYGLGIWNAPFINYLYSSDKKNALIAYKAKVDPNNIMNPGKIFSVQSKWLNIPALVFRPGIFGFFMKIMIFLAPVIGKIATLLMGKHKKLDSLDFELTTHACAKCGNCIAVCPAYLVTKNEEMTAKGKIALAKKIIDRKKVTKEEAENVFMCMHCKGCEEICQTNLELMLLWDALEKRIEEKFGRPEGKIDEFLKEVDASKDYWEMVDRNN